ncbi:hypothetical protein R1flu_000173 [Riccia fluitans]|uniref:Uncharacterized protein n=1 Tax=Riccia fluitans TaxID=41844 RepID=A0ABD1XZW0_9MARC
MEASSKPKTPEDPRTEQNQQRGVSVVAVVIQTAKEELSKGPVQSPTSSKTLPSTGSGTCDSSDFQERTAEGGKVGPLVFGRYEPSSSNPVIVEIWDPDQSAGSFTKMREEILRRQYNTGMGRKDDVKGCPVLNTVERKSCLKKQTDLWRERNPKFVTIRESHEAGGKWRTAGLPYAEKVDVPARKPKFMRQDTPYRVRESPGSVTVGGLLAKSAEEESSRELDICDIASISDGPEPRRKAREAIGSCLYSLFCCGCSTPANPQKAGTTTLC